MSHWQWLTSGLALVLACVSPGVADMTKGGAIVRISPEGKVEDKPVQQPRR